MIYFKCSNSEDIAAVNRTISKTAVLFPGSFAPCVVWFDDYWHYEFLSLTDKVLHSIYDAAPHAVDIPLLYPELII